MMLVFLNIYDVNEQLNPFLGKIGLGMYHSGVEINGKEYQYSKNAGVQKVKAGTAGMMPHLKRIKMGDFNGSVEELDSEILMPLNTEFTRFKYDLTTWNCNHFSDALLKALTGHGLPGWVNRAAHVGDFLGIAKSHNRFSSLSSTSASEIIEGDSAGQHEETNLTMEASDSQSIEVAHGRQEVQSPMSARSPSPQAYYYPGQQPPTYTVAKPWAPSSLT